MMNDPHVSERSAVRTPRLTFTPHKARLDGVFSCSGWITPWEWAAFTLPVHLDIWATGAPFYKDNSHLTQTPGAVSGTAVYNGIDFAGATGSATLLHWNVQTVQTP